MQKTPFAGLTVLEPNESLYSDNAAFIERDRFEIDRELKIGVKTHRHDALAGLHAPIHGPSGVVIGSGGSVPAGVALTLGLTFVDAQGGETLLGPTQLVTTPSPIQAPTTGLVGTPEYSAGSLGVDTYTYAITYRDENGGETPLGPPVVITRDPGYANATIVISNIKPGGEWPEPSIAAAILYRARAGGEYVRLAEVTTDAFADDGSVSPDCDIHPPSFNTNTTGGTNQIKVTLGSAEVAGSGEVERAAIRLYCSQSGIFDEDCLVGSYPTGSAGATTFIQSLALLAGQPPDLNRSFGGADKIDPDTELLDWHWKRPVSKVGELPVSAEEGDVRAILSAEGPTFYVYLKGSWQKLVTLPSRVWKKVVTGKLAHNVTGSANFEPGSSAMHILKMKVNKKCRVRVYGDTAARTADLERPIGTDPTGDHGVQLDYAAPTEGGSTVRITPPVHAANLDEPAKDKIYLSITNEDTEGAVEVEFLLIPMEVV